MDCAPLNLAHFHERRAEKFLRHHRYDEAYKAIETSLLYIQNAYKNALIDKSIEVLNTQKWDYERKLRQIKMRQLHHERLKLKEIVPLSTDSTNSVFSKPESSGTVSKSINKTIEDFDAKYSNIPASKENQDPKIDKQYKADDMQLIQGRRASSSKNSRDHPIYDNDCEDFPSLEPLELPTFDFSVFTTNPALPTIEGLMENLRDLRTVE